MSRTAICSLFGGALALIAASQPASAGNQTFNNPSTSGDRLDWCMTWGQGCGAEAATAWCVAKGFENASDFAIAEDIGSSTPTRLLSTGAVCDQGFCDGFDYITCHSSAPTTTAYNKPKYQGDRLDYCLTWGQGCGQEAANAFCQWKGHASAQSFTVANDIGGSTPTRLISTGAVCDQGFCDGFGMITCEG
jgi:hypothetical protein